MQIYNMMTCQNLGTDLAGGCGMAWAGLVVLFFVAALCRKWLGEEMDVPFDFIVSVVAGFLIYIITVTFFGSFKWALLTGLIGLCLGFIYPLITGGSSE